MRLAIFCKYISIHGFEIDGTPQCINILHRPTDNISGLGSSTVDQVLKYTKYPKYIPSTSTGQVLIFLKKYLSTSSTFRSSTSTSTSTSTHIKICSKVRTDIQSRVNFRWTK